MNIPEDLKLIYHDAKTFESSPSISNPSLVALIERIAALTDQLEETRNNLRQMTECRDDLNRLVAQRDKELAQARADIDSECAIVNRIWAIFGTPSYEELAGKSIYDLINGVIAERDSLRAQLEQMCAAR